MSETRFYFFYDKFGDNQNPIIIVNAPKSKVLVADRTDKSEKWTSSICTYEVWEQDKSKIPIPEFLIQGRVPIEYIEGVMYEKKMYSRDEFIEMFESI